MDPISLKNGLQLLYPGPTLMVTSCEQHRKKTNVMALSWITPVNINLPMVFIALSKKDYTSMLLLQGSSFIINNPDQDLIGALIEVGSSSGRGIDKINVFQLPTEPLERLDVEIIKGCLAYMHCEAIERNELPDHYLLL